MYHVGAVPLVVRQSSDLAVMAGMTLYYVYVAMLVHHNGVEAMRPSGIQNVDIFLKLQFKVDELNNFLQTI